MNTLHATPTPDSKKSYQAPQLQVHGALRQLTQAGSNPTGETINSVGNDAKKRP